MSTIILADFFNDTLKMWDALFAVRGVLPAFIIVGLFAGFAAFWKSVIEPLFFGIRKFGPISREKSRTLDELLADPNVISFYETTQKAWASGSLEEIGNYAYEAKAFDLKTLIKRFPPHQPYGLSVLFTRFTPEQGEFLIGLDKDSGEEWYVLTNKRYLMRDDANAIYKEIRLNAIQSFAIKAHFFTVDCTFKMRSGEVIACYKGRAAPTDKQLAWAQKNAEKDFIPEPIGQP